MAHSVFDRYIENEVLNADATNLIVILYRAAIESIASARLNIRKGEIRERSQRITKASAIVHELLRSLNHADGGDISRNLAELYAYMQARLMEANATQTEAPLAEVESLLRTLLDAWTEAAADSAMRVPADSEKSLADLTPLSAAG